MAMAAPPRQGQRPPRYLSHSPAATARSNSLAIPSTPMCRPFKSEIPRARPSRLDRGAALYMAARLRHDSVRGVGIRILR
jgi:hypothetical protein